MHQHGPQAYLHQANSHTPHRGHEGGMLNAGLTADAQGAFDLIIGGQPEKSSKPTTVAKPGLRILAVCLLKEGDDLNLQLKPNRVTET